MQKNNKKKEKFPEPRINDELRGHYDVRVIYTDNDEQKNEVMSLDNAKRLSDKLDLDLIEINANAPVPIMRIDNYEKWLYNAKKKAKENKPTKSELKEIQLSVNIGKNDLEVKANKAKEFISDGDKVKVVLKIKGRENTRREESKKSLYEFIVMMQDVAVPESMPKDEGNKCMVIMKKKK